MKVSFEVDIGFLELEASTEDGRLEAVWLDGQDFADKSVEEFILAICGGHEKWSKIIAREEEMAKSAMLEKNRNG